MRIYLSGKITGREKEDYTIQFARAESFYKTGGFDVVNPVTIGEVILKNKPKAKWEDFMQEDLKALRTCTHIVLLEKNLVNPAITGVIFETNQHLVIIQEKAKTITGILLWELLTQKTMTIFQQGNITKDTKIQNKSNWEK